VPENASPETITADINTEGGSKKKKKTQAD